MTSITAPDASREDISLCGGMGLRPKHRLSGVDSGFGCLSAGRRAKKLIFDVSWKCLAVVEREKIFRTLLTGEGIATSITLGPE